MREEISRLLVRAESLIFGNGNNPFRARQNSKPTCASKSGREVIVSVLGYRVLLQKEPEGG